MEETVSRCIAKGIGLDFNAFFILDMVSVHKGTDRVKVSLILLTYFGVTQIPESSIWHQK